MKRQELQGNLLLLHNYRNIPFMFSSKALREKSILAQETGKRRFGHTCSKFLLMYIDQWVKHDLIPKGMKFKMHTSLILKQYYILFPSFRVLQEQQRSQNQSWGHIQHLLTPFWQISQVLSVFQAKLDLVVFSFSSLWRLLFLWGLWVILRALHFWVLSNRLWNCDCHGKTSGLWLLGTEFKSV